MKKEELQEKSTEKLRSTLKGNKIVVGALVGILTFLLLITIYGLIVKEEKTTFIALLSVVFSCGAILPGQFNTIKKIKEELKTRENKS
ncbi:hypothetical protein ACFSTE_09455 [Aquimarina hainanensis]|uniref:FUSC family protein n=1 Tax=Aquimarina hainanensis TaxID=1578017 RepID=A0ABW5N7P3_9FLAO|nr:hypothetical protein [Aquimarina sp. TRL1]QKX03834.1 hypothetical protein HN014_02560 [Aquimarina sp. TRL1]